MVAKDTSRRQPSGSVGTPLVTRPWIRPAIQASPAPVVSIAATVGRGYREHRARYVGERAPSAERDDHRARAERSEVFRRAARLRSPNSASASGSLSFTRSAVAANSSITTLSLAGSANRVGRTLGSSVRSGPGVSPGGPRGGQSAAHASAQSIHSRARPRPRRVRGRRFPGRALSRRAARRRSGTPARRRARLVTASVVGTRTRRLDRVPTPLSASSPDPFAEHVKTDGAYELGRRCRAEQSQPRR